MLAKLISVKWHLMVVLICISIMTNNTEHLFMCLLDTHVFSFVKRLFKSFADF